MYTNLETCNCHYVFPCFDQPDMKSKIKLYTSNHVDWEVISSASIDYYQ